MIRMPRRIQQWQQAQPGIAVRDVVVALAPLVLHHLALVVQGLLGQGRYQSAHPVGLEPQAQFEVLGRQGLEIVGPVRVRGRVQRAAGALDEPHVFGLGDVQRTLEHQVLEEVCEAGLALGLMSRAHVVPEVDADDRSAVVLAHDDAQPVGEAAGFNGPRKAGRRNRRGW
jgi:hypothetical protein